ncbi:hypothetical protein CORT_0C06120 [Candida orthopsilosis Co 90-125]|uniref:Uncharacterized protein n=1 Tax=Candida orthopsilosis (strain 90-125) TaxID=1136231 RepID=H8X433_CANO9|nr:hypothetical protein CORT_0C06120 [Candida orthopsilosis Co 90-125]CCG25985.1 hypothetical protein CORT_0C06120 [Candida orthopsilosis Co 90-125]
MSFQPPLGPFDTDKYYTATHGALRLLLTSNNDPDEGTGVYCIVDQAHGLMGPKIAQTLINNVIGKQIDLLGRYPYSSDVAPSILFAALFGIVALLHLFIFLINTYRGHYFLLSLFWAFTNLIRFMSFVYRAVWAQDIINVRMGIADEILLVIPSILLISGNLILAQRLFTWRHPVGGSRNLFWFFMMSLYCIVAVLLVVAILASAIPYMYFLSPSRFNVYKNLNKFVCVMLISYTLTASSLIGLSFWLPTKKDERLYTYQPWWIESFAPFYFVKKGAAQEAEATFMKRNSNHRHAIRVIAATHHHYNMVEGLTNQRGDLKHNISLFVVIISTIGVFVPAILRAVVVFQTRQQKTSSPAAAPTSMYFCWGVFEFVMNVSYIVGRADLRFYRPDVLPAQVRAIITAEQSQMVTPTHSDNEEEEEYEADDKYYDHYHPQYSDDDENGFDFGDGTKSSQSSGDFFFGNTPKNERNVQFEEKSDGMDSEIFTPNQHTYTNTPANEPQKKIDYSDDEFQF